MPDQFSIFFPGRGSFVFTISCSSFKSQGVRKTRRIKGDRTEWKWEHHPRLNLGLSDPLNKTRLRVFKASKQAGCLVSRQLDFENVATISGKVTLLLQNEDQRGKQSNPSGSQSLQGQGTRSCEILEGKHSELFRT